MRVARVVIRAPVVSFRHPFFVTGRQPTFDIPPPSTIYGHCASAAGELPDPALFFFGIHFEYKSKDTDLEHQHIVKVPKTKGSRTASTRKGKPGATAEVTVQPVWRDFLFDTTLTLYLPPAMAPAFRAPVYPVVLGRSQDLAEICAVEEVALEKSARIRFEHTLLPRSLRPCVRFGTTVLLTRYIGPPPEREAMFAQYICLHEPVFFGEGADPNRAFIESPGVSLDDLWCDPAHVDEEGFARGVWIHRLVD